MFKLRFKFSLIFYTFLYFLFIPHVSAQSFTFAKYIENPVFLPYGGSWYSKYVANPSLLKINSEYKMWYEGNNGNGLWEIGYASSPNGVNTWQRLNTPSVTKGSLDNWEYFITDPKVIVNPSAAGYIMWYSSVKQQWVSGPDRYRLRYALSTDGIIWNKTNQWILIGSPNAWDSGGPNRGTSILFKDNIYHLWYAATNDNDLTVNPYWRIGYATSSDGINWTKQNGGNPVIEPTESWELNNVSFPTVIDDNGTYKMWYGVGSGDAPTQVAYAYSTDGITWTKPAADNPVITTTPNSFDSMFLTITSAMKDDDGVYKLWYSGLNGIRWAIGLATSPQIPIVPIPTPTQIPPNTPTPSPTPTPTPTNTPTPTPTPTNTPTQTPTPPETKKVIVIPGFGASWNADALINCKIDGYQGSWNLHPLEKNIYPSLYASLSSAGYTPIPFYYDWRKQLGSQTQALTSLISSNTSANERVDIVGHSFGGLVGRAYILEKQTNSKIDKYLSAGSPHRGTPFAYPAWAGGEIWKTDFNYWVYMTTMIRLCQIKYRIDSQDAVQRFIPSTRDILPIFPYLRNEQTNQLKSLSSMSTTNQWLPSHPFPPAWGTIIGTLSGNGQQTLSSIRVKDPSKNDIRRGEWIDGKPTNKEYTNDGDGTIVLQSSQVNDADNRVILGDHSSIVSGQAGQQEIISFLNGTQNFQAFGFQSLQIPVSQKTSALLVLSYPAHVTLTDPDGNKTSDTDGIIAINEPKKGKYSITISPRRLGHTKIIVAQFYDNGKYYWKEYSHWLPTKKQSRTPRQSQRGMS